jgi:hypothetical protein
MTNPAKTSPRRLGKAKRAQHLTLGGRDVGHAALCPTYKLLRIPPSLASGSSGFGWRAIASIAHYLRGKGGSGSVWHARWPRLMPALVWWLLCTGCGAAMAPVPLRSDCPDSRGMTVQFAVEWVSRFRGIRTQSPGSRPSPGCRIILETGVDQSVSLCRFNLSQ